VVWSKELQGWVASVLLVTLRIKTQALIAQPSPASHPGPSPSNTRWFDLVEWKGPALCGWIIISPFWASVSPSSPMSGQPLWALLPWAFSIYQSLEAMDLEQRSLLPRQALETHLGVWLRVPRSNDTTFRGTGASHLGKRVCMLGYL
jgi:hypothetical protein